MRLLFLIMVLSFQIAALAETPSFCRGKLSEYEAKIKKIKTETQEAMDSQIGLLGNRMTTADVRKLILGCHKIIKAVDHWEHAEDGEDAAELWKAAEIEVQRHAKFIENLIYRDRASWDANIKSLQNRGYQVKVDVGSFKIHLSKDLTAGERGHGTQRIETVLDMCSPVGELVGAFSTAIVVSASENPSEKDLLRLTGNNYALEHLPKECNENIDSELAFLKAAGALLPERSILPTIQSAVAPQKVIDLEGGKGQREQREQ